MKTNRFFLLIVFYYVSLHLIFMKRTDEKECDNWYPAADSLLRNGLQYRSFVERSPSHSRAGTVVTNQ